MKYMMSALSNVLFGAKVFWVRDREGRRVSVLVVVPESTRLMVGDRSQKIAERAERLAVREACRIGPVVSKGVFLGGDGNGSVVATGIAEMSCTPEVERRLSTCGIQQLL